VGLAVLLMPFSTLLAQQTGTVQGTVTGADGQGLVGAAVSVEGTALGTLAGDGGVYSLSGVPAGPQTLRVAMLGYAPQTQQVNVPADGSVTGNFVLEIDALNLEAIVVTGTATETRKVEATFAVTNLNSEQIIEKAPQNTAELLEVVPGFYVESSGGEGGNNVWARGIPQDGGFRYVAMYEDGLPVFESPELAFTNIDLLYRTDATVRTLEAVRGGSASIFASNAPGGQINFVSHTGGDQLAGVAKLSLGDYSMFRTELNVGGPIAGPDWRFNVGGFYRFDRGVRDPGFPANSGGQLKANVTRLLDNGYVRVYAKYLDDSNIFYLPVPLETPIGQNDVDGNEISKGDPKELPGFDANYGTMTSNDASLVRIPTPVPQSDPANAQIGGVMERNLKDGMHVTYRSFGAEGSFDLGNNWTISDRFRRMTADVTFNAIFSVNDPQDATDFAQDKVDDLGGAGFRYSFTNSGATFNPANANGNGLVAETGWWTVTKPLSNFSNDFRVTKGWLGTDWANDLTLGFYFSDYSADEFWLFNRVLQEIRSPAPRLLELEILDGGGDVLTSVTQNGFTRYGDLYVNHSGDVNLYALYAQDTWRPTEKWTIDGGLRWEYHDVNGQVENASSFDLGFDDTTADDNMEFGNGSFDTYSFDFSDLAYSIGLGYMFNRQFGLFGRWTDGFRVPDFEQWIFSRDPNGNVAKGPCDTVDDPAQRPEDCKNIEDVKQAEVGVKFGSPTLGIFATGFWTQLTNIQFSDEVSIGDDLVTANRFADTRTIGLETEIVWVPVPAFEASWTGTIQNPEYRSLTFDPSFPPPSEEFDVEGNQIRRVPKFISALRLAYGFGPRAGNLRLWGTWGYIDKRFVDDANLAVLPGYHKIDAGLSFDISRQVGVQLVGNNLTNEIGLTEGNPRTGQVVGQAGEIGMARPILGANGRLTLSYHF
jgi:outer membrane receptor protein involved in Fe transport